MPLPSQTARISAARTPMFRKRRRSPKPMLLVSAVILGLIGLWWVAGQVGEDSLDGVPQEPLSKTTLETAPASSERPAAEPEYPPPTLITLGTQPGGRRLESEDHAAALGALVHDADRDESRAPAEPTVAPAESPAQSQPASHVPPAPTGDPVRSVPPPAAAPEVREPAPTPGPAAGSAEPALPPDLTALLSEGRAKAASDPVAARQLLTRALVDGRTPENERERLRGELGKINDDLVFSPRIVGNDPFVTSYAVQSGDALEKIARKNGVSSHWRLIQRVNRLANPNRIQLNQKLKVVKGPFHAVVIKSAYRLDLYMGEPGKPQDWVYVRSFRVGLGEGNSTPTGDFIVRRGSKLENPYWTNPRTGEQFSKDDPKNPIGERWVGLEGLGESAANTGYGIHGTIDPDSIGQQKSMGCVRLATGDVELVYDLLGEGVSLVRIVP